MLTAVLIRSLALFACLAGLSPSPGFAAENEQGSAIVSARSATPAAIRQCMGPNPPIERPFDLPQDCKATFRPLLHQPHAGRAMQICEQQRSEAEVWCRDVLRGEATAEQTDQLRQRALVIRVLLDLFK